MSINIHLVSHLQQNRNGSIGASSYQSLQYKCKNDRLSSDMLYQSIYVCQFYTKRMLKQQHAGEVEDPHPRPGEPSGLGIHAWDRKRPLRMAIRERSISR